MRAWGSSQLIVVVVLVASLALTLIVGDKSTFILPSFVHPDLSPTFRRGKRTACVRCACACIGGYYVDMSAFTAKQKQAWAETCNAPLASYRKQARASNLHPASAF